MWAADVLCVIVPSFLLFSEANVYSQTSSNDIRNWPRKMRNWFLTLDPCCCISSTVFFSSVTIQFPMSFAACPKSLFYCGWFPPSHVPPLASTEHSQFQPKLHAVKKTPANYLRRAVMNSVVGDIDRDARGMQFDMLAKLLAYSSCGPLVSTDL